MKELIKKSRKGKANEYKITGKSKKQLFNMLGELLQDEHDNPPRKKRERKPKKTTTQEKSLHIDDDEYDVPEDDVQEEMIEILTAPIPKRHQPRKKKPLLQFIKKEREAHRGKLSKNLTCKK